MIDSNYLSVIGAESLPKYRPEEIYSMPILSRKYASGPGCHVSYRYYLFYKLA